MIYLTSDFHFGHDREFIYGSLGFTSINEHDKEIIYRFNEFVADDDIVFILGDLMLGNNNYGLKCINELNGKKYFITGNHDTDARVKLYEENGIKYLGHLDDNDLKLFEESGIKWRPCTDNEFTYKKYRFKLSHQPQLTGHLEAGSLHSTLINLYGHTHQRDNFYEDRPYMYHVGIYSHNCCPVSLERAIKDMQDKVKECLEFL